jgi:hypothetical protein
MSVRLHYPEVFEVGHGLDDQTEGFIDFEQGLDWTFRMVGHEGKRQITEGSTQAG